MASGMIRVPNRLMRTEATRSTSVGKRRLLNSFRRPGTQNRVFKNIQSWSQKLSHPSAEDENSGLTMMGFTTVSSSILLSRSELALFFLVNLVSSLELSREQKFAKNEWGRTKMKFITMASDKDWLIQQLLFAGNIPKELHYRIQFSFVSYEH